MNVKYVFPLAAIMLSFQLSACNTIEGMGKDVEEAGDTIENEAREHNNY